MPKCSHVWQELERLLIQQETDIENCKQSYEQLSPVLRLANTEQRYRSIIDKWEHMWSLMPLYFQEVK